jgi:hypothetical protein
MAKQQTKRAELKYGLINTISGSINEIVFCKNGTIRMSKKSSK